MSILSTTPAALASEQDEDEVDESILDFECPICYVNSSTSTTGISLTACSHSFCTPCLKTWIEKEEAAGEEAPKCPTCRVHMCEGDVHRIIARSYERRVLNSAEANSNEIDEFTLHWLNTNTVLCRGCGSRIEKVSGCNLIECLCGYRFCYLCQSPGGRCGCNQGHGFLGMAWGSHEEYIIQPVRDSNGLVNIKSCIERRRREAEGGWIRSRRWNLRELQKRETVMFWRDYGEACRATETGHGRWIFSCTTDRASVQVLTNIFAGIQTAKKRIQGQRAFKFSFNPNFNADVVVGSTWLFLREGADFRALKQLQNRHTKRSLRRHYYSYDWELYESLKRFQQLFDGIEVRRRRCEMRASNEEVPFNNGAWLFYQN